jgi:hypothetical protein
VGNAEQMLPLVANSLQIACRSIYQGLVHLPELIPSYSLQVTMWMTMMSMSMTLTPGHGHCSRPELRIRKSKGMRQLEFLKIIKLLVTAYQNFTACASWVSLGWRIWECMLWARSEQAFAAHDSSSGLCCMHACPLVFAGQQENACCGQ